MRQQQDEPGRFSICSRQAAVVLSRSINEDPQLYSALFLYEKNEGLLSLSFEREYSIFINSNLECILRKVSDIKDKKQGKLQKIMNEFVRFKYSSSDSCADLLFLSGKLEQIRKIYEVFDRDRNRLEFLNYIMKKERVIFEREFERLLGEKNGDF
ncbi:hypothetical protein [Escherichia coli]|uniref:hypothetical protein n=1 Tax=Escherichia coli TaxID=562 RepID=UPI0022828142|nr:hypothetical protein [Escherichia coli]MCZ0231364.1 hypothetical protein [Escherichia coli]MCZ0343616.1 hypothetical protein [Escherichia coli]MCZ0357903.1 hypothetical protein [Escherichia coli]